MLSSPLVPGYPVVWLTPVYQTADMTNPYNGGIIVPTFTTNVLGPPNSYQPSNLQSHTGAIPGGFYLTGLDPRHTGVLTVTYVWESFPCQSLATESTFVTLQQQSTDWDPLARQIAQCLLAKAPSMGYASDNDNWTWLAKTFGSIGDDLSKMIGMIPHPIAQAVAGGTRMAAGVANDWATRQVKKNKKKKIREAATVQPRARPTPPAKSARAKQSATLGRKALPPIPQKR